MAKRAMAMAVLLAACLSPVELRSQEPAKKPADQPLLKVDGQLTRDDPVDRVLYKSFHKVYAVKMTAGTNFQIDLISKEFDAFLRLEDAQGKQLALDDDGGEGLNARIVFKAEKSATYRVIATTYDAGKGGRFLLTVRAVDLAAAQQQKFLAQAKAFNAAAQKLYQQAKFVQATELAEKALQMVRQAYPKEQHPQGHVDVAISLNNLGFLYVAQGEYSKAEPLYRQSLEIKQRLYGKDPKGNVELATSLDNLGSLLHDQGEYTKAEPMHRQALAMYRVLYPKARYPQGNLHLANSLNNLGILLHERGENGEAEPLLRQALEMKQALYAKDPRTLPDLATSLNNLGHLLHAQGEVGKAEALLRQALKMRQAFYGKDRYPKGHPDLAGSLGNLGNLFHGQGEDGQAEPLLREALEMREAYYSKDRYPQGHPELAASLNILGGLHHRQGNHGQAEPLLRQALAMYTQLGNRLAEVAPESVALNAAATFPLSRDAFLSATGHLSGSDERTYEAVWHSRAALTRVYQRRHLALMAVATDDSIRKTWDRMQALRRQREQLIMAPLSRIQIYHAEQLRAVNQLIDTVDQELLPQLPAIKHYQELAKLGPNALQKLLPANASLIDFLRYTQFEQNPKIPGSKGWKRTVHYLAFVVSRRSVKRVELGTGAPIDEAVRQWREAITARLPGGNDAARTAHEARLALQGAALRRLLWEPVEKLLASATATVFLAPDAELTQMPWAALPGKGKDRVLLDDYALAVLPHGPFLLEQLTPAPVRCAKRPPAAEGLLLVGGIRYDDQPNAIVAASRGADSVVEQKVVWNYLKGTDEERQLLVKVLEKTGPKVTVNLSGAGAPTARMRQELERCRYAHIGTHGFFADAKFRSVLQLDPRLFERTISFDGDISLRIGEGARSPLVLSGLVCAEANRPETPDRGILSGDAIAGLLLDDLHLAVLSACDTGIGDVAGGEGVFGLQRAFHIAGCKNVVASLWKVDDAATAALMTRFYGHLFAEDNAKRLPPIEALRRAQLDLYRHPELIPAWSKGDQRAPGPPRPATTPSPPDTPPELLTSNGRTPIRLWAAFTLSGLGR